MTELIIMRGLPGCGKSTWAATWVALDPARRAEVNRDHLRKMMHRGFYSGQDTELQVIAARDAMISVLLKRGVSVVCSDTNLPQRTARDLVKLAVLAKAEWRIADMTDVPLETCLERNQNRDDKDPVPEHVILDYHNRYIAGHNGPLPLPVAADDWPGVKPYVPDPSLPPAIIVDIDGTVALKGTRDPYDETRVHEDRPNLPVIETVWAMTQLGYRLIFLSGRTEKCKEETIDWIRDHIEGDPGKFELHMRKQGDMRKDRIVKAELFDKHVRGKYNVLCVFDDRDQVVALWREMGLVCMQVAEGAFLAPVAQRRERQITDLEVAGSSPAGGAKGERRW